MVTALLSFRRKRTSLLLALFISFCLYVSYYEWRAHQNLNFKIESLKKETIELQEERSELVTEQGSLHDSDYVELFLMEKLGLVPEGQIKVHFSDS